MQGYFFACEVSWFSKSSLPVKYPTFFNAKSIWDDVIQKNEHRLAGWKRTYSSKGEMITLMENTLSNLSMYFISLFPLPAGVVNSIEKLL